MGNISTLGDGDLVDEASTETTCLFYSEDGPVCSLNTFSLISWAQCTQLGLQTNKRHEDTEESMKRREKIDKII